MDAKAAVRRIIQVSTIVGATALFSGCTVPGSYFGSGAANHGFEVNKQWLHPTIIKVDTNLILHPNYLTAEDVSSAPYQYRIGAGDVLLITVWDHPELSSNMGMAGSGVSGVAATSTNGGNDNGVLVDALGNIFFPYAGSFRVTGLTADQIRIKLQKRLAHYIHRPQVSVRVSGFRSQTVNVIGEVSSNQVVPITDQPLTILTAINGAGGISANANPHSIFVIRGPITAPKVFILDARSPDKLLVAEKFRLRPKDIVFVPATGVSRWNNVMSQILPTVQTVWFTHTLTKSW